MPVGLTYVFQPAAAPSTTTTDDADDIVTRTLRITAAQLADSVTLPAGYNLDSWEVSPVTAFDAGTLDLTINGTPLGANLDLPDHGLAAARFPQRVTGVTTITATVTGSPSSGDFTLLLYLHRE